MKHKKNESNIQKEKINEDKTDKNEPGICNNDNPKNTKKKFLKKKRKLKRITSINIDSFFILDFKDPKRYLGNLEDKNRIKLTKKEYEFLKNIVNNISFPNKDNNPNNYEYIELTPEKSEQIKKFFKINPELNDAEKYTLKKIQDNAYKDKITCRKLSKSYYDDTGIKFSKDYFNKILKNKFGMSYLKTTIKTTKINNDTGLIAAFYFIKMITKCMILGFRILFLDETSILSTNNNYRGWRKKSEELYFNIGPKRRENLLLIVSDEEVIHYKINSSNTNEQIFLGFMEEVYTILSKRNGQKFVILMDNLSVHRTKKLMEFYKDKKLNIIFNCVYRSNFNVIELAFRIIKFTLYNKLYENMESTIEDVKSILDDPKIKNALLHNFKETINQYINFFEKNEYLNLNNLNV